MRYSLAIRYLWLAALLLLAVGSALAQDNAAPTAISAPAKAQEVDRSEQAFATYPLITDRIAQRGGISGNIGATRTVEGALSRRTYRLPAGSDVAGVVDSYRQRLVSAGFEVLYDCKGEACGPTFLRASPGYRAHGRRFDAPLSAQRYLAVRRPDTDGDAYTAVQAARTDDGIALQVDTLTVAPRKVDAIAVNAAQMARDLATSGRVVLYGIFFNTDSAEIKADSRPTLNEIARLMRNESDLRLLVVGHTDSRGKFDYNINLSTRRARAVVDALVRDNGIDDDRLKPWGVGYSSPRASNNNDVGQAKNRRVELVVW